MLESITLRGDCGPSDQSRHLQGLPRLEGTGCSLNDVNRPFVAVVESPLTGADITCRFSTGLSNGQQRLFAEISIPVMAALDGQNYFHDNVEWLWTQAECVYLLVGLALRKLGMKGDEIHGFRETMSMSEVRFAWHCQRKLKMPRAHITGFGEELCHLPLIEMFAAAGTTPAHIQHSTARIYTCAWLETTQRKALEKAQPWLENHQRVEMVIPEAKLIELRLKRPPHLTAEDIPSTLTKLGRDFDVAEMRKLNITIPKGFNGPVPAGFDLVSMKPMTRLDMLDVAHRQLVEEVPNPARNARMQSWSEHALGWLNHPKTARWVANE